MELTGTQRQIWKFISDSQRTRTPDMTPPSLDEIADGTGLSVSWVATTLRLLEAAGKVRLNPSKRRSLWVVELFPVEKKRKSA